MSRRHQTDTHHIRQAVLDARRHLSDEARAAASLAITQRFLASREFFAAKKIACYFPMRDEVDTRAVFERCWRTNKRVFAPVICANGGMLFREVLRETTLQKNHLGVWEPVNGEAIAVRRIDIVVTPLVAFDANGNRIGMGGGYFDRCFAFLRHRRYWLRPKMIALAYQCQEVEKISPNPWDIPLYRIYSE